jgi:hypothetical protein
MRVRDKNRLERQDSGQTGMSRQGLNWPLVAAFLSYLVLNLSGGGGEDRTLDLGVMNPTL